MKHKDAGLRCLVAHLGSEGELLPACKKCSECGEWLRPDEFVNGQCLPTLRAVDPPSALVSAGDSINSAGK